MITVLEQARQAREAAAGMGLLDTAQKNEMLKAMAKALIEGQEEILQANAEDLAHAKENGVRQVMMDRLALTSQRIADMAVGGAAGPCRADAGDDRAPQRTEDRKEIRTDGRCRDHF